MMSTLEPRAVIVSRASEYEVLLARHGTKNQARFFLRTRGQDIEDVIQRHRLQQEALSTVSRQIPNSWRRAQVARGDLDRFLFEPGDVVLPVGQDGLVANVAKYVDDQLVVGFNPDPASIAGVLVRWNPDQAGEACALVDSGEAIVNELAMVHAQMGDGQELFALNELFIGHRSHQSARYRLAVDGEEERQSSSGVLVSTGTGSTGWASSLCRNRTGAPDLRAPMDRALIYLVREAWPSVATGVGLTDGVLGADDVLRLTSEMEDGVVFGDGIESDALELSWGRVLDVRLADRCLRLVV